MNMSPDKPIQTIIAIPTRFEASGIASKYGIPQNSLCVNRLIELDGKKSLIVTGVARKSTAAIQTIAGRTDKSSRIVLAGFCGCRNKAIPFGKAFVIQNARYGRETIDLYKDATFMPDLERTEITTLDSYGNEALADMESYHFAKKCRDTGIRLYIIRVVSDHCDMQPQAAMDIFKFKTENIPGNFKAAMASLTELLTLL